MKELDFEAVYQRYHQALYRFCLTILGDPDDARDAVQNTMVKALRSLPGEQREIQLKPWLYRVAHNEAVDLLRRRREQVELDADLASAGAGTAEAAEMRERLRVLLGDLRALPERQRSALVMRELGGLELAEIATALDTSPAAARQTVYEARRSLGQLEAGREMSCEKVQWELSGEDGRVTRRREIQAHLRQCAECRAFRDGIAARRRDLAALAPLPAVASAGLLHSVLAAGGHGGGGGLGGALAAGTGKAAAGSAVVKSAATIAVVAAIAVPTADRAGLVDVGLFKRGTAHSQAARPSSPSTPHASGPDATSTQPPADESASTDGGKQAEPAVGDSSVVERGGGGGDPPTPTPPPSAVTAPGADPSEPPSASTHGQETAGSHSGGRDSAHTHSSNGKGKGRGKGHSRAPGKPPAHHPHPSHERGPPAEGKPEKEHPPHPPQAKPPEASSDDDGEEPSQRSEPSKSYSPEGASPATIRP